MKADRLPIGDICSFEYGEALKEKNRLKGKVPVYGSNGVVGWHNHSITQGPTIIIGRKGSIGEVNWSPCPCFPIDTTYYIDKTKKPANLRWLYYALLNANLTKLNKSAAVPGLNREDAYERKLRFPNIKNQAAISKVLDEADRLRSLRQYALELSDSFLQSVFIEIFGDPINNPKRWNKQKLSDICQIRRGASPRPIEKYLGGTVPWIKIGDGTKGDSIYLSSTEDHVTEEGAKKSVFLRKGTLVFANSGVSCGFARILTIDGCIHDGWLAFEGFEKNLNPIYFLQALNNITLYLRSLAPEGTQPNLNTDIMGDFQLIIPPINEQQRFEGIVKKVSKLRLLNSEACRQAEHLFKSLLHESFCEN